MELKTVSTKRASALLKNHPQRELWNDAAIGVMLEHEQKIAYANDAYACALGYPSGMSLIGMPIKAVIASHDRPRLLGYSRSRLTGNYAPPLYAFRAACRNGTIRALDARVSRFEAESVPFIRTEVLCPTRLSIESFEEAYDRYSPSFFALALRITGADADAAICLERAFSDLWAMRNRTDLQQHSILSQLMAAIRRNAIERRSSRSGAGPAQPAGGTAAELPELQKRVFDMAYFDGLSIEQIARATALEEDAVRRLVAGAVRSMRQHA